MSQKYVAFTIAGKELDMSFGSSNDPNAANAAVSGAAPSPDTIKNLLGVFHSKDGSSLVLDKAFAKSISSTVGDLMPDGLSIKLNSAMFGVSKQKTKTKFLLGDNFGDKIDLANLPLVGKIFPPNKSIVLDRCQLLLSSAPMDARETAYLQAIRPDAPLSFPATLIKGANFDIPIKIGGGSSNMPLAATNPPPGAPTTTPTTDYYGPPPVPAGNTKWIALNKSFGPVTFKRIGGKYESSRIWLLLDAEMAMGPITVTLAGLSVSTPVNSFSPRFDLEGLGLSYSKGSIGISGALLRDAATNAYTGMAMIKTPGLNIAALGGYQKLDGQPSLFVYGAVSAASGPGIPAVIEVTGMSAGFGYNRTLNIPDVSYLKEFPLVGVVTGDSTISNDPIQGLRQIKHYIPASTGDIFLAFGLKFLLVKMLDVFALVTFQLGNKLQVDLLGIANLSVPATRGGAGNPLVQVELAMRASYNFHEKALKIQGRLTPNSYLFSRDCQLTGGFAYCMWMGGPHAGDFVYTMGGYHPDFNVPAHYPRVPRLRFHWQITPAFTVKGELYFALVPTAVMAGGSLKATYVFESTANFSIGIAGVSLYGKVEAWLTIGADFIISWQPYYYKADLHLSIGIRATFRGEAWFKIGFIKISKSVEKSFDLSVSAGLSLWGPEFAGIARVNWSVVSFEIRFGAQNTKPSKLSWTEFKTAFLPADANICAAAIEDGLLTEATVSGKTVAVVNPAELVINTHSAIPSKQGLRNTTNLTATGANTSFGIGCMDVSSISSSTHKITVTKGSEDKSDQFGYEPILKNAPEAMWGKSYSPDMNKGMKSNMLMGFRLKPKPKQQPSATEKKTVRSFGYQIEPRPSSYKWGSSLSLNQATVTDAARRTEIQNIDASTQKTARSNLLKGLGLDGSSVDLSGLSSSTANAFLVAPKVYNKAA